MADDNYELSDDQVQNIREAFFVFDPDKKGIIPTKKLGDVMRNLGHQLRPEELGELIKIVDQDSNGTVDFDEFLPLMAQKIKEKQEEEFYKNLFRMLDKKKKGFITCDDLRYILKGLRDELDLSDEEINDMIQEVDEDGNNEVSFDEFFKLMTSE
ncbi:calmodulin-2/4 [Lingula anatina]|uniref:Calmodulin-2/4 n=1 Tax=Lingula anatina TaxID=7574 RepID=A0A1S3IRB2_LINAN|nr:calmodulin-2/4 [Lingula anatina]|eukprot:XP_013400747.1 calmodulin-2/4 [Lingula anatina]